MWPAGLKSLRFGKSFNRPIGRVGNDSGNGSLAGVLPDGLQELQFGREFNQVGFVVAFFRSFSHILMSHLSVQSPSPFSDA